MNIIVVGGGPAGMMAAITAAQAGAQVTLIEQNEKLGKKLFITGKGRCNLTNASGIQEHLESAISNPKFLYSAIAGFDSDDVCSFFGGLGLRLKTERGKRVFPESDHSSDVIRSLEYELRRLGVKVMLNTKVAGLVTGSNERDHDGEKKPVSKEGESKDGKIDESDICGKKQSFKTECIGVRLPDGRLMYSDRVILATGGVSYPLTGADGSGLAMVEREGIKVTKLYPALVPLVTKESWVGDLAGLSLKNVSITVKNGKKLLCEDFGEMLFTHRGVSGPLILSASSRITRLLGERGLLLCIDLKPALSVEVLDKRLIRELDEGRNKQIKNIMDNLLPKSMVPVVLAIAKVSDDKRACDIKKEERQRILETLKSLPLTVTGTEGFDQAIITQGGISTKEIDPKTMGSKKVSGLYFAGECIDVDSLTGGFNLQIAWSTGYAAGRAVAGG